MRRRPRSSRESSAAPGGRFWIAVALVVLSLLWLTTGLAPWAVALCVAGVVLGLTGMLWFGLGPGRRGRS